MSDYKDEQEMAAVLLAQRGHYFDEETGRCPACWRAAKELYSAGAYGSMDVAYIAAMHNVMADARRGAPAAVAAVTRDKEAAARARSAFLAGGVPS